MADQKAKLTLSVETKNAKQAAADINSISTAAEKTRAAQEKLGAAMARDAVKAAAATKTVVKEVVTLDSALGKIKRTDAIDELAVKYGKVAKRTKDATAAAKELNEELKKINATEGEIQGAAGIFSETSTKGLGPRGNALQQLGAQGRNLPSMQIPGAGGIGTDAVSNLIRLTGALGELTGAAGAMANVTAALAPALGATVAGIAGVLAVAGPVVLVLGALGLAMKSIGDQAAVEAKAINTIVEGQRSISQRIADGLNSEQAVEELEVLNQKRRDEAEILARNKQVYDENINSQTILQGVVKLTSGAEEELANQITKGSDLVKTYDNDIKLLTEAQVDGSLAANDAADAEKRLADERSKTALASADTAATELQAEQKALGATAEQNEKRLASIVDERAVIEKQIEVLEASGVTSEEVTKKIESLNAQLGSLGKETSFITDTALEVSKARDAEKKAAKDAEDAAKKAAQAQEQYTKAIGSANTALKNSTQDIGSRLNQTLSDNTTKLNRDLSTLSTKYNRDEYELTLKANRSERDALLNQKDNLADIQREANKGEQEALRDGDFKALYLSRTASDDALKEEAKTIDKERLMRDLRNRDAREDLLRNVRNQRQDRLLSYDQQNIDAQTHRDRELQQAQLTRNRSLALASQAMNAELGLRQQFWNATLKQAQAAIGQINNTGGKGQAGGRAGANSQALGNFIIGTFGGVIR